MDKEENKYNKLEEMISNISAKIALINLIEQNNFNYKNGNKKKD